MRWIWSGPGNKDLFFDHMLANFQDDHPNISMQRDSLPWDEIGQIVPLGVQNGNAHDVFQLPLSATGAQAVREGWVSPLNDLIPDFEEWKAGFPPGLLVEGINTFDGLVYGLPPASDRRYSTHLLYNVDYLERAGYDPATDPLTWDQFRDAARKITQAGGGDYHGLIIGGKQTNRWTEIIGNLAQMAGAGASLWQDGLINWHTGEFLLTSDEHLGAVELMLAISADGSLFPGSLGIDAFEARGMFPQGVAGMILQGPWNILPWQDEAPDFDFGVASQPIPDTTTPVPLSMSPGGGGGGNDSLWIYSGSKYKAVAGEIFGYIGSQEGQQEWARFLGMGNPPAFDSALENVELDARSQKAFELFSEQLRFRPDPVVRNTSVTQVMLEWRSVTPDFGTTVQGIMAGELDARDGLQQAEDQYNAELDRAIKAAQDKGAEVSREDFVFPNWDPTRDYLEEDYAAL